MLKQAVPTFLFTLLIAGVAHAESAERKIQGWTADGAGVVVHLVQRGERMVDGVSKDYYFELTELHSSQDGTLKERFKFGTPVGSPPPAYDAAKTPDSTARQGLVKPASEWTNAEKTHRLMSIATTEVVPAQGQFLCRTRHRIAVADSQAKEVRTIADATVDGETAARPGDAECPVAKTSTAWHPDGRRWAVLVEGGSSAAFYAGSVDAASTTPFPLVVDEPLLAKLGETPELKRAWRAVAAGDFATAREAFETVAVAEGQFGVAIVAALEGEKSAQKTADAAYRSSDKGAWDVALRGAAYLATGDAKRASKWIDQAVEKADGYDQLLAMAALYHLIDVGVANQLAVWALSHDSAKSTDTTAAWNLLARGLLDVNEFSKAEEALAKVEKHDRTHRITSARLALDRGETRRARDLVRGLLAENLGDCEVLGLAGRIAARDEDTAEARQLFDAAAFCDPTLEDAVYYAADFARLANDVSRAAASFEHYLTIAPPRRGDPIREARRVAARRWAGRLRHEGIVMTQATCSRSAGGALCRGVVANTSDENLETEIMVRSKKKKLATQRTSVAAGKSAPFGLRVEAASLDGAVITAGKTKKERELNETPLE